MRKRCRHPEGITIKILGEYTADPCRYKRKEIHQNVTVEVSQCEVCGHIDITWHRQDDTISDYFEPLEEEPIDD